MSSMTLKEMLAGGYDNRQVVEKILSSDNSTENKKKALLLIKQGVELADGTVRKVEISQEDMIAILKSRNIELTEDFVDVLCKYYEGKNAELKEKIKNLYRGTMAYTAADGGFNSSNNEATFRQRIQRAIMTNIGESASHSQHTAIAEEIAYVVVNSVLSADKVEEIVREEFPQEAEETLRLFRANYAQKNNVVGGQSQGLAAQTIANGYADPNAANNTTADITEVSNLGQITKSNNAINNSFETSRYSGGNTSANAISINGSTPITDRRAAFLYQLNGIMSYWDVLEFISDMDNYMHDEKGSKNNAQTKHDNSMQANIHEAVHEMAKDDAATVENEHREGIAPVDENKNKDGAPQIEDDSDEIGTPKYDIPKSDYIKMGRAVGAILSHPEGKKTLMEILQDIDNMRDFTDAAHREAYNPLRNKDEKHGGNYVDEFKVLFAWAKKVPVEELQEILESNQDFKQNMQETKNQETYESGMAAAKEDMEDVMVMIKGPKS